MSEVSQAALYGRGLFTTIRIIAGEPWLWEKHWRRLSAHAKQLEIDLATYSEEKVLTLLKERLATDAINNGRARITFRDNRPSDIWPGEIVDEKTTMSIVTGPPRHIAEPFRLTISPHTINSSSPISGLKTCNYLEPLMSFNETKTRGFHESVRLNERGQVTSACMANIFWLKDGRQFTPSLLTGCLAGTTREFVLEGMKCEEVEAGIGEINNADAIFLTSAGLGVVAVSELDARKLPTIEHKILQLTERRKHDQ